VHATEAKAARSSVTAATVLPAATAEMQVASATAVTAAMESWVLQV
jgi:hypothetical protein